MPEVTVVLGDITTQDVDAIVNAANTRMRGGGGVDRAIHRAGGPEILTDCIARFPPGLSTGDAGWTTAGRMPASWVIHTVGPNYRAGETDRGLAARVSWDEPSVREGSRALRVHPPRGVLVSCYRRSLEVADELGAMTVAFPLISAGSYGWPRGDAIRAAVETLRATESKVGEARIIASNAATLEGAQALL